MWYLGERPLFVDKLQYVCGQYGEPDTDPYWFCQLAFEEILLVPEDIPDALDYQKNRKNKRKYVNGDRVKVTAWSDGFVSVGLDYKSHWTAGYRKEESKQKSFRKMRIFVQEVTAND